MADLQADLFQTNPEAINNLLSEVASGKLALPQFQRDFIWAPSNTASLLTSIMARYPAGSLLLWRTHAQQLEARPIANAPDMPAGVHPDRLILDGQQRVTALFRSLKGKTEETYFVFLSELMDPGSFFDPFPHEKIVWDNVVKAKELTASERRAFTRPKNPVEPEHRSLDWQYEHLAFPIGGNFDEWIDGLVETEEGLVERKRRRTNLRLLRDTYLKQLETYRFPVTTLSDAASLAAVCSVFEKLNSNSIRLGPYEILTAKFFKDKVDLRAMWEKAKEDNPVFRDPTEENDHSGFSIDPYLVLQIVTLIKYNSPQRKVVLEKLEAEDVKENWDDVTGALRKTIEFLRDTCGVIHRDLLPYQAILAPTTGAWLHRDAMSHKRKALALDKIAQYFWSSVFTTNFDQGGASQAEKDYRDLIDWLDGADSEDGPTRPEAVATLAIQADNLLSATVKKKALLQGIMALTIRAGARDFHNGEALTPSTYVGSKFNSHHLFPKARLNDTNAATKIDRANFSSELILNRALIDAETNKRIGAKKPSAYLADMQEAESSVADILESHLIDEGVLASDDYSAFLLSRLDLLIQEIESVTGKSVEGLSSRDGLSDDESIV